MLNLIFCEFAKIKRQKFILFSVLAACLFPIPMTILAGKDRMDFTGLFNLAVFFGNFLLLPCVLSIVTSILFFMERDHETLKNLLSIPVNRTGLAFAKLYVILVISLLYSVAGLGATMIGGLIIGGIRWEQIPGKLGLSVVMGLLAFLTALPVLITIIRLNKSMIFSILLAAVYTFINFSIAYMMVTFPPDAILLSVLPAPIVMRWWAGFGVERTPENYEMIRPYLISGTACMRYFLLLAAICIPFIVWAYRKQED